MATLYIIGSFLLFIVAIYFADKIMPMKFFDRLSKKHQ